MHKQFLGASETKNERKAEMEPRTTGSVKDTELQAALWPSKAPTDPKVVQALYDANAAIYTGEVLRDGWKATFDHVVPEIRRIVGAGPARVLDAGCGDGLLTRFWEVPDEVLLYGVDLSAEQLKRSRKTGKYEFLGQANLEEGLPFDAGTFDLVVSNGVLSYINSNRPLAHIVKALAPGGAAVLAFRHADWIAKGWESALPTCGAVLRKKATFDPFPKNDAYTHKYVLAVLEKTGGRQQGGLETAYTKSML